ncbi:MAG: NUDIX hydrolase [Thermoplasmata archaeon]
MARPLGPALTADAVWIQGDRILLVRRGRPPFQGKWALPGGFVEMDETVEAAVARELREETGLRARPRAIVGVYSGPDRDPRGSTTTVAFLMVGRPGAPRGGDDAATAAWVPVGQARGLAFDHDRIVRDARRLLRRPFTTRSASGTGRSTRGSVRDGSRSRTARR